MDPLLPAILLLEKIIFFCDFHEIINKNLIILDNIKSNMVERSSPIENSNTKVHNGSFNDHAQTEWLHFDDTKVKSLSNNEFQRKIVDSNYDSPYILFYVRD